MKNDSDFSKGVRGKYYKRYRAGTNLVLLDKDIVESFPDSRAVNTALRGLIEEQKSGSKRRAV